MDLKFLKYNNINNSCVSYSLNRFKSRFNNKYNLSEININSIKPCIFFGIYNKKEWNTYFKYKGPKFILFGGTDINPFHMLGKYNITVIKNNKITNILVLSENTQNSIKNIDITSIFFDMNLVNKTLFFPNKNKIQTNKIYCYNGTYTKPRPIIYGGSLLIALEEQLPQFEFIFSSNINYKYEDMPQLYNSVFIVLRLTSEDGNANTVQECEAMNTPVVHNNSKYGLKYKNKDDIINHINNEFWRQY